MNYQIQTLCQNVANKINSPIWIQNAANTYFYTQNGFDQNQMTWWRARVNYLVQRECNHAREEVFETWVPLHN